MKNFSVQVSDGVKRIVLAGLVCLTAVLVSAVAINGAKKEADVGNAFAATTVTTYATCASNNGMLGCDSKTPTCVYTTSGASTTYKSTACANGCYGGKCIAGCTYSTSDPKGASAAQCTENNQYCSKDNLCYPGCYGYDANGQLEVVTSGKSTCAKPGQDASQAALAPDAVYKCQGAPKYDIKNNISGTVTNWTTNSDGSLTKYGVTGLFYNEDNESEVCNYADCYNGACTGNGESDNLCSKTAAKIKAAFDKYMGYKKANTIKIALDKISNDTTLKDADKTAQMKAKIKEFKESLLTILNAAKIGSSGDDPDSGKDAEIMKQLEKMIFPADYAVTKLH